MIKKQLVVLWIGIVAILLPVLPSIFSVIGVASAWLFFGYVHCFVEVF